MAGSTRRASSRKAALQPEGEQSDRIHAHIAITALSLLLERTIEHACQDMWRNIRDDRKRIQLALLSSPNGRVWQVTGPSIDTANRLKTLKIKPTKPILSLD